MKKLLVIEDTQDSFDLVADALGDLYEVHRAETGPEGITRATTIQPDLILLDMSLPAMDGWEVARHLRAVVETAGIPVIALTAHAMKGDRERCIAAGCTDYVAKPVNIKKLIEITERYAAPAEDGAAMPERR